MEFIPESLQALGELDPLLDDDLVNQLARAAERAQVIAPGLAGMSMALRSHDVTFTLVASDDEIATLDAMQYLGTGPCVEALEHGQGLATTEGGLLSEERWQQLASVGAAMGIRSTITFPITFDGDVVGTLNLYGHAEDTFVGKHQELADALNAWAPGAVTNADLAFTTLEAARRAPEQLRRDAVVDTATGFLAAELDVDVDQARRRLDDAATRAGISVSALAQAMMRLYYDG